MRAPPATLRLTVSAGGFAAAVAAGAHGVGTVLVVATLALAGALIVAPERRAVTCILMVGAVALGGTRGVMALTPSHGVGDVGGHLDAGATALRGHVADAGVPGRDDTVVVDVVALATRSGTWQVTGRVVVTPLIAVSVLPGDLVDVEAPSLRAPPHRAGSLGWSSLERVGVVAVAVAARITPLAPGPPSPSRLAEAARRALAAVVAHAVPEPVAAVLLGVALGIHAGLPGTVRAPLQDAGLVHLVAVSGLKVALVAGLIAGLARSWRWSRRVTVLTTVGLLAGYVTVSGGGVAAVRSSLAVVAGLVLARDGRRPDACALLALCAALLLGLDPAVATDVGFQLSFLGTAGILLLAAPIAARLPGPRAVAEALAVTVSAQLATLSVTGGAFGVVSLVAPIANALVLPLLPAVIVLGGAGATLSALLPVVGPALGWAPLQAAALGVRVILAVAQGVAALPFAAVPVPSWQPSWTWAVAGLWLGGAYAWALRHHQPSRRTATRTLVAALLGALVAGTLASVTVPRASGMRVTVLAVGNATAVLVRPTRGGLVLIDTGSDGAALMVALSRVLSPLDRRLDVLVLTATDRASAGAMGSLEGHDAVGTLVVSQPLPAGLETVAGRLVGTGTIVAPVGQRPWSIGGAVVRCLPSTPAPAAPCVVQVTDGGVTLLVTGALPIAAQDELSGLHGTRLRADLVVGPSTGVVGEALLGAAAPAYVAIPATRAPAGTSSLPVPVGVTGRDGDLDYQAGPDGLWPAPA